MWTVGPAGRSGLTRGRRGVRWWPGLFVMLLVFGSAGCVPVDSTRPFSPLAIRLEGEQVAALDTSCTRVPVNRISVVRPGSDNVVSSIDPVVWEVTLQTRAAVDRVLVGQAPEGSTIKVALTESFAPKEFYAIVFDLSNGHSILNGFEMQRLAGGTVSYHNRYMSAEDFASLATCPSSS